MKSQRKTNDKAALTLTGFYFFKNLPPLFRPSSLTFAVSLSLSLAVSTTHFPSWLLLLIFFLSLSPFRVNQVLEQYKVVAVVGKIKIKLL